MLTRHLMLSFRRRGRCGLLESLSIVLVLLAIASPLFGCPEDAPILLDPSEGSTVSSVVVTFRWSPVAGAAGYRLWVTNSSDLRFLAGSTFSETELTAVLAAGESYGWSVEAVSPGCTPARSTTRHLSTPIGGDCDGSAPAILFPPAGTTTEDDLVDFSWSPAPEAEAYRLVVQPEGGVPEAIALTAGDTPSATALLPRGRHRWWVEVIPRDCPAFRTAPHELVIDSGAHEACDSQAELVLLAPSEGQPNVTSPVIMDWTAVAGATGYRVYAVTGAGEVIAVSDLLTETRAVADVPPGSDRWFLEAFRPGCPVLRSLIDSFAVQHPQGCVELAPPDLLVPRRVSSGTSYRVVWNQVPGSARYELQESETLDFADPVSITERATSAIFLHDDRGVIPSRHYRVRALADCDGTPGPWSAAGSVTVEHETLERAELELRKDLLSQTEREQRFGMRLFSRSGFPEEVRLSTDQAWLRVDPAIVTLTPEGTTVTVESSMGPLPVGSSSATLFVEPASKAAKGMSTGTTSSIPVTVSLVTPVSSTSRTPPDPDALILPAIAHTRGPGGEWASDVRLLNAGASGRKYEIFFHGSASGTSKTMKTVMEAAGGTTVALNDLLVNFFGAEESATSMGTLEIRSLKSANSASIGGAAITSGTPPPASTFVSSRTFSPRGEGSVGQYIPAFPFARFIGSSSSPSRGRIYLPGLVQTPAFRTNLGIVEGSGERASVALTIYDERGAESLRVPIELAGGAHRQINALLAQHGIELSGGYATLEVTAGDGMIAAYASIVDNRTNDAQLVLGNSLQPGSHWVVPGIADLDAGAAHWRSDVTILNPGEEPSEITLSFVPQGDSESATVIRRTVLPGTVLRLDAIVSAHFALRHTGGALHVHTEQPSPLVITAFTYHRKADGGTVGQLIPAFRRDEGRALGDPPLQILLAEQSEHLRTNLGIAEIDGSPVTVRISAFLPGARMAMHARMTLDGSEFIQQNEILKSLGLSSTYNGRLTVSVMEGAGRIVAYGSLIDNRTNDPTFIPAR